MTVKSPLPLIRMFTNLFFVFLEFGSTVLYKKWVLTPVNLPEALSSRSTAWLGSPVVLGHPTQLTSSQTGVSIT